MPNAEFTILQTYQAVPSVNVGSVFPLVRPVPGSEQMDNGRQGATYESSYQVQHGTNAGGTRYGNRGEIGSRAYPGQDQQILSIRSSDVRLPALETDCLIAF